MDEAERQAEIAALRARLDALQGAAAQPVQTASTATAAGGFKVGFFGCFGFAAAGVAVLVAAVVGLVALSQCSQDIQDAARGAMDEGRSASTSAIDDGSVCGFGIEQMARPSLVSDWATPEQSKTVQPPPATVACPVRQGRKIGTLSVTISCNGDWSNCIKAGDLRFTGLRRTATSLH